mgnify:CR=1 FL=1
MVTGYIIARVWGGEGRLAGLEVALRSELELELAGATGESALESIRTNFTRRERLIEHEIDTTPHTFSATIDADYNFLAR